MGGILVLGLKENNNSCADSITPLPYDKSALKNKLRGLVVSHTIPSISLKIQDIDTDQDNPEDYILVLKVPEAQEPVMYINSSDSDSYKYFFRYNEDTLPADHATIRLLFSKKNIEEILSEYLKNRDYGLNISVEEDVVSWIAIPYQFPLETFTEITDSTISEIKNFFQPFSYDDRCYALLRNGRFSHQGILFSFKDPNHRYSLYDGYLEIKNNGYIEFKAVINIHENFLIEK